MITPRRRRQLLHALEVTVRVLVDRAGNSNLIEDMKEVREIFRDLVELEPSVFVRRLEAISLTASACLKEAGELLELTTIRTYQRTPGDAMSNNDPVGTCDECGDNIYEHDLEDRDDVEAVKEDEPLICSECAARKRSLAR